MALSIYRPGFSRPGGVFSISGLWLAAGLAMVALAACTYFLLPEESFAIASGLLILLLAVADLRCGFLAFVILYPFMPISWGVDVAEWMPYLTAKRICCLVLSLVFLMQGRGAWDTPRVRRIAWFMVALVMVQMVAGFGSRDPLGAVKRTFGDAVEWYFPFLIASHLFRTKAQIRTLFTLALISMGVSAVLAIIEHGIDYNFFDQFVAARQDIQTVLTQRMESHRAGALAARRVRVAFNHPIELGLHLMCVLLLITYFIRQRGAFSKIGVAAGLPLYLLALLFTYSRGPMLGLACGVVWLGLVGRGTRSLVPALLFFGVCAYFLMPTGAREILDKTIATTTDIQTSDSIGGGTVRARISLLQTGLQYSAQNLWFGVGPSQLQQTKLSGDRGEIVDFASVDNFYLQVLLRHGLFTLVLTIALYGTMLGMFVRGAFRLTDRDAMRLAAIGSAICIANFVALVTVGINITLFWILLGPIIRACDLYQPMTRKKREGSGRLQRKAYPRAGWSGSSRFPASSDPAPEATRPEEAAPLVPAGARHWRALAMGAAGLAVLLLIPTPLLAAPSFYGTTGLFVTPTAQVAPRGTWSAGANYLNREFRNGAASFASGTVTHSLTVTLLPRLEVAALLTNWEGKIGVQRLRTGPSADFPLAGYNADRMVALHWMPMQARGQRPAVAIGVRDAFGTDQPLRAQYAVASWQLTPLGAARPLTLSAGVGTQQLGGPFGGAEFHFDRRATFILEALRGQVNGGFRLVPLRNFQMDAAFMNFHSLGGGLSYRRRF